MVLRLGYHLSFQELRLHSLGLSHCYPLEPELMALWLGYLLSPQVLESPCQPFPLYFLLDARGLGSFADAGKTEPNEVIRCERNAKSQQPPSGMDMRESIAPQLHPILVRPPEVIDAERAQAHPHNLQRPAPKTGNVLWAAFEPLMAVLAECCVRFYVFFAKRTFLRVLRGSGKFFFFLWFT